MRLDVPADEEEEKKIELRSTLRLHRFIQETKINGGIDSWRISLELVRVLHELDRLLHHFPRELRIPIVGTHMLLVNSVEITHVKLRQKTRHNLSQSRFHRFWVFADGGSDFHVTGHKCLRCFFSEEFTTSRLRISPLPVQTFSVCHLLRCGWRVDSRACRIGLSQESIVDQETIKKKLTKTFRTITKRDA